MKAPTDRDIAAAQRHARAVVAAGRPVTECPYDANGDGPTRVLAARWVQAYTRAKGSDALEAVDYTD